MTPEMELSERVALLEKLVYEQRDLIEALLAQNDVLINYAQTSAQLLGLKKKARTTYEDLERRADEIVERRKRIGAE